MRQIRSSRWQAEDLPPLAALRFKSGYSRTTAAEALDVSNTTLFNYETGIKDIPFKICEKMSKIYNVPFEIIRQAILKTPEVVQEKKEPKNIFEKLKDRAVLEKAVEIAEQSKQLSESEQYDKSGQSAIPNC